MNNYQLVCSINPNRSLLRKLHLNPADIDYLVVGTVIQEAKTANVAREVALTAGLPLSIPAHTCTQACISANQAITQAAAFVNAGMIKTAIAGGVEFLSDVPIRVSRKMRKLLLEANKAKGLPQYLSLLARIRLDYLKLEVSRKSSTILTLLKLILLPISFLLSLNSLPMKQWVIRVIDLPPHSKSQGKNKMNMRLDPIRVLKRLKELDCWMILLLSLSLKRELIRIMVFECLTWKKWVNSSLHSLNLMELSPQPMLPSW